MINTLEGNVLVCEFHMVRYECHVFEAKTFCLQA